MRTSRREFLKASAAIGGGITIGYGPLGAISDTLAQKSAEGAEINVWVVVRPDDTAEIGTVKVDDRVGSLWLVTDGLKLGERVVVEGGDRVRAGQKVRLASSAPSDTTSPK